MSNMKAYLAANYMSGPKADAILARLGDEKQKKKRKKPKNEDYIGGLAHKGETNGGLSMKDEDEWRTKVDGDEDMEGEDAPVQGKDITTFKKSKSGWATVGSSAIPIASSSNLSAADAGVEAGPSSPRDIKPDPDAPAAAPPKKRKGGLRTAAQLRADLDVERAARSPSPEDPAEAASRQKTVHRDESGRVIDIEKLKAEERAKEAEEKRKELEREQWTKGLVQRRQNEERRQEEKRMAQSDVARHAGDAAMNREMREQERWNDPAAAFLSKKKGRKSRRPKYQGAHPANRFGIPPGYRWDGVDRSNGFEKKYFQYQNAASRKELEQQQWSMEDM